MHPINVIRERHLLYHSFHGTMSKSINCQRASLVKNKNFTLRIKKHSRGHKHTSGSIPLIMQGTTLALIIFTPGEIMQILAYINIRNFKSLSV